jgi:hypothetical protein
MNIEALAALLKAAGHAHHQAFIETDGDDPAWATWYAGYLHTKLQSFFGRDLSQDEIAQALNQLDERYRTHKVYTDWPTYYAQALIRMWG